MLPLTACGGGTHNLPQASTTPGAPTTGSPPGSRAAGTPGTTQLPHPGSPPLPAAPTAQTTQATSCVDRVMARMSAAQRVGQLFMSPVSTSGIAPAESAAIRAHNVGSIFLMGHSNAGVRPIRTITDQLQSTAQSVGGAKVRLFTATDQEGGKVQILNGPGFSPMPSAVVQGQWPVSRLQGQAADWGRQLRAAGVNLDLAPVVDVVPAGIGTKNQPIGALSREYGDNPTTVARQSSAFIRGLSQAGVDATIKHFPGLGQVRGNTDFSANVVDSLTQRNSPNLAAFRSGIQAGARFTMVSSATYTLIDRAHQAVFSSVVIRDMLRGTLGFNGVIITDDVGHAAAVRAVPPGERALRFLAAGGNMILTVDPSTVGPMANAVLSRLGTDAALRRNVDDSVRRILTAKLQSGLLHCG
ncbi:glycoside hydrolase family 3 N-terminal domain-containing protein [Streptantibioticus ferralitis]|uniref:beta-N-acetylhexosaminidase n=1 Tax=Streptantibioticus ferralitis TaxID=236510 RepID=A0ABT5Z0K3_9ACTN|nr:glycoside hydrolase family 3 N-terminal domain-containing protein [Streptantibioticus ferralitis]MDF2257283.1 glycoside hydrolase family 3 N-terminal domain-containing protein [Streptantibioticus ferralitis]